MISLHLIGREQSICKDTDSEVKQLETCQLLRIHCKIRVLSGFCMEVLVSVRSIAGW